MRGPDGPYMVLQVRVFAASFAKGPEQGGQVSCVRGVGHFCREVKGVFYLDAAWAGVLCVTGSLVPGYIFLFFLFSVFTC